MHCAQHFVNSSLVPVVRLKSVGGVLKGIRRNGFSQSRWNVLLGCWDAVFRHGRCGPISSLHPWDKWVHPVFFFFFYKWVFDSLELLMTFFGRLSFLVGISVFVTGLIGFGRI